VSAWNGQSLDNKPFLSVDGNGNVFITDPYGGRVLEFNSDGQFLRGWSDLVGDIPALVLPAGVAVDAKGGVWVSDASANHLLHFTLPPVLAPAQPPVPPQIGPQEGQPSPTSSLK
jgi:streptogramin lyase